jgi:flavodoxin
MTKWPAVEDRRLFMTGAACVIGLGAVAPSLLREVSAQGHPGPGRALTVYHTLTGHTKALAQAVHAQVGGDLVQVETVEPYPTDDAALAGQARHERDTGRWPQIRTRIADIRSYDIVFLGSPIWGGHLNPPMKSFLAAHDLSGRAIAPFVSYMVSGMGQTPRDIREVAPDARLLEGLAVLDRDKAGAETAVSEWLRRIQMA